MTIRVLDGDIHLIDLKTRMPFRYGIATMTEAPHAFVRLRVVVDEADETGVSADLLPPKWFTKEPAKPLDEEVDEMLLVIEHAVRAAAGLRAESVFGAWRQLWDEQDRWGREKGFPPLLTHFGTSLVERALIEAFCRKKGKPFHQLLQTNHFGIHVDAVHPLLNEGRPADYLTLQPETRLLARHTIGLSDPLDDAEVPAEERLEDGLPQSLVACVRAYGLQHFKIKVSGELERDRERLRRIAGLLTEHAKGALHCTLDGNEHFRALDAFRAYWEALQADEALKPLWRRLGFVEQPFHRSVALDTRVLAGLRGWADRPRLIIDESDAELNSLPRALELGYHGTSHKNCKGVIKGIANACLIRSYGGLLSGEDLANVGPVALLQDLAVCAALNVASAERNGHHYFAGLSQFPQEVQRATLEQHGDLYHAGAAGWPTLTLSRGCLALDSVRAAPFGVAPRINVELFTPLEKWRQGHRS
jgi:hypothetical protein